MADNLGPNGLVVSAGKCAASMAAENCFAENIRLSELWDNLINQKALMELFSK